MRIWAKEFKDNHMLRDMTVEDHSDLTRTKKVYAAIDKICVEFDLSHPIWLEKNIKEFKKNAKTRFTGDSFIDTVPFDFLEIQVLEEDL